MDDKQFENLNMVPFIDIMLVLLVIVLTTSTFIASGKIPVSLPQASSQDKAEPESLVISIKVKGELFFLNKEVSLAELKNEVAPCPKDKPFLLHADKRVALQEFIKVADMLNASGFTQVAIETEDSPE